MKYVSIGIIMKNSTEEILNLSHCIGRFRLTGLQALLWLRGRQAFAATQSAAEIRELKHLEEMGLVILADDGPSGEYFALTRATLVCTEKKRSFLGLTKEEKMVLTWMTGAGLHLTAAEVVYLVENRISPKPELLGEQNRQALVERIYTTDTIADSLLELQMAHVPGRDKAVRILMSLVTKGYLILI